LTTLTCSNLNLLVPGMSLTSTTTRLVPTASSIMFLDQWRSSSSEVEYVSCIQLFARCSVTYTEFSLRRRMSNLAHQMRRSTTRKRSNLHQHKRKKYKIKPNASTLRSLRNELRRMLKKYLLQQRESVMMIRITLLKTNLAGILKELQVTVHNSSKFPKDHIFRNSLFQDNAIHVVVQQRVMNTALLKYIPHLPKVGSNSYSFTQDFSEKVLSPSKTEYADFNGQDFLSPLNDEFQFTPSTVPVLLYLFLYRYLLTFPSESLSI
jgi:hypothetical protein